jgi:ATP adenylyltransferase/5',5'''-P-1,P-4-tetraphosphate phosphorylase II
MTEHFILNNKKNIFDEHLMWMTKSFKRRKKILFETFDSGIVEWFHRSFSKN